MQGAADLVGHVGEKPALGLAGPFGFILGLAQLARARRDELLEPLAVGAELGHGGGHPRAARRVLPGEEERQAEHVDRVGKGAGIRRPDLREIDEEPERESGQDHRRAGGDHDRAGPITLPNPAGDEESIDLDRQHQEVIEREGRSGRRADRQQARAAPGQRHRSQLEDGSAQRRPLVQHDEEDQQARDERPEDTVAATAEVRKELEEQRVTEHGDRHEPVERGLALGDRPRPEERGDRQAKDRIHGALDREHEEDPLVPREPPVDREMDGGAGEEARENRVDRDQPVHGNLLPP